MNRYSDLREIGGGTFGVVYEATDTHKGEKVAIKRIKQAFASWKECLSLREVASLTKIPKHPHIVRLRQLILENKCLNFVFEYLPNDLLRLMRAHKGPVPEPTVRRVMWQLLQGLHHMHRHGFFHRDLKPENLLCAGESLDAVDIKICDLGQAREVRSRPPYTEYVSTRWYRSPEILLRSRHYNSPADMWAAGVVMAELLLGRPVFPGTSEVNQLYLIMDVVGPPAHDSWSEGARLMAAQGLTLPRGSGLGAASLAPDASPAAKLLLTELLAINPQRRATAAAALASEWFAGMPASAVPDDDETAKAFPTPTSTPTGAAAAAAAAGVGGGVGGGGGGGGGGGPRHSHHRGGTGGWSTEPHWPKQAQRQDGRAGSFTGRAGAHGRASSVPQTRPRSEVEEHGRALATAAAAASGAAGTSRQPGMNRGQSDGRASGIGQGSRRVSQTSATGSHSSGLALAAAAPAAAAASAASSPGGGAGGGRPSRLLADDASADVIAMARELGVGVSPVGPPGGGGLRSRLFDGPGFDRDGGSAGSRIGRAGEARVARDRLSPVPAMSDAEAAAEAGPAAHLSVDTDNIEALLGSLGQGAVV